ncbi:AAA family ATPase [Candidatus Hodarchaeum mangrovi]
MDVVSLLKLCKKNLIGLDSEISLIISAIDNQIPVMIEGDSGTGKTELAKTLASVLLRPFYRVDGDENLTINKIRGWFDPPLVMKLGFSKQSFVAGPLVRAMQEGGLFFFNEVNRAPSESLNGVLAAMDERKIDIPQMDRIEATNTFYSIFTLNPQEYVGTNPLPEAFFDRCILIKLSHKSGQEAEQIVQLRTNYNNNDLISKIVKFTDETRISKYFERGASVRAAIQLTQLLKSQILSPENVLSAIFAVYSGKVKLHPDIAKSVNECLKELAEPIFLIPTKNS